MADYTIIGELLLDDDTAIASIGSVGRAVDRLESKIDGIGSAFRNAFGGLLGVGSLGAAVAGIIDLNSEIQNTKVGLAGLFTAQTGAPIESSMKRASNVLKGLRADAKAGVGELSDYTQAFQLLVSASQGAASDEALRKLTRNVIAGGEAMRPGQGSRLAPLDIQQALTSGANDRTTPFVAAALRAAHVTEASFNALSIPKRIEVLNKAFEAFSPAVAAMGKTWGAQFDTLKDNTKDLIRTVTSPLFDKWTGQLQKVNEWLSTHQEQITKIAKTVGSTLVSAWDAVIKRAKLFAELTAAGAVAKAASPLAGQVGAAAASAAFGGGGVASLVAGGAALVGIVAVVGVAIASLYSALRDLPDLTIYLTYAWDRVKQSVGSLLDHLSQFGIGTKILDDIGYGLVGAVVDVLLVVDAITRLVDTFLLGVENIGNAAAAVFSGDFRGAMSALTGNKQAIRDIWKGFLTPPEMTSRYHVAPRGRPHDASGDPAVTQNHNNFTGPVTIAVKTEINTDPARVAVALNEALKRLDNNRQQGGRAPRPGRS